MKHRTIDYSRYRTAEAIVERFRAGEDAADMARDHFAFAGDVYGQWLVELIVAAYDRRGMHRPIPFAEQRRMEGIAP